MTDAPQGLAPLPFEAVGEFVPAKQVWLLDNVEVIGKVESIGVPPPELGLPDPAAADGDDFDIIPDPSYIHLIDRMRGNAPLMWKPLGTPRVPHCETYPMEPGIAHGSRLRQGNTKEAGAPALHAAEAGWHEPPPEGRGPGTYNRLVGG